MSNENDHGRPTLAVTGPQDRAEPEELANARPGKEGEVWPPPVYRDVTGRPIPLAAGWEHPDGERPRDHAHQRWAGAAAAMKDEAASLFAADSRQTQADYRPPVSYPARAGGSAFFTGARQAANDQQTGGQAIRTGGQATQSGGQAAQSGSQAAQSGSQAAQSGSQAIQDSRAAQAGTRAAEPWVEQAPYAGQSAEQAEAPRRPLRDYQQNYPRTEPGGFEQPLGDDYAPFEDYQPGQTGAQPHIQGQGWDEPQYRDGRSSTGEQPAGWQQVQPSQQLNRYAGGPAAENYSAQDETRRAPDGWNAPQENYSGQDEPRRERDDWNAPQSDYSTQDETRRAPENWNAPQSDYPSQDETRRAPDGWSDPRQDYPGQDETRRAPDRARGGDSPGNQGWAAPARQEPYEPETYEPDTYEAETYQAEPYGSERQQSGSGAYASDPYGAPAQPPQGGFPDPEREYDQIRQRGGRLLGGPWPDDPGYGDQNDWDDRPEYRAAHGRAPGGRGRGNPPRGGRNGNRRRISYRTRAGAAILIIVALAVGRFVSQYSSDVLGQTRPFLREGTVGKPVDLRYAQVTATDAQGSACVSAGFNGTFRSPGVFVVVPVKIVPKGRAAQFQYAAIEDSEGRLYTTSTLGRSSFEMGSAQAGVARYATVMIEMPKDRLAGARLRLALNELYTAQDDMTDIDLGISAEDVKAWAGNPKTIAVGESSDLPPGQNQEPATAETACEGPVAPE